MANCPVDSMKTGGLSWFSDLTVPDPYYILPVLTSVTLFIQFYLGVEYGTKLAQSKGAAKVIFEYFFNHHRKSVAQTVLNPISVKSPQDKIPSWKHCIPSQVLMYVFPPLLLIFTHSFPAALTFYWLSTNIFSVGQVWKIYCVIHLLNDAF